MITSEAITKAEVLTALNNPKLAQKIVYKFKSNLECDRVGTIKVAKSVARDIIKDLDEFFDMHSQV